MSCMLRLDEFTCSAGFECLTEDLEEVVGLFNEVIQEPALQQDKVAFYKAQVRPLIPFGVWPSGCLSACPVAP